MNKLVFLSAVLTSILNACGGGSSNNSSDVPQTPISSLQGNVVDDFLLNADVKIIDEQGNTVAVKKTGDLGFFEFDNVPLKNYRIVISGGVQDVDGLAVTTGDQKPNTAILSGMALPADRGKILLISALTTGVDQYAKGDAEKYKVKTDQLQRLLDNSIYLPLDSVKSRTAMKFMAVTTEAAGGFTKLVRELADDGAINSSVSASPNIFIEANEIAKSAEGAGFDDPALLGCFLNALPLKPTIYSPSIFESVTSLWCNGLGIASLKGIEQLTNLETINLSQNKISKIAPLSNLNKLESAVLTDNNLKTLDLQRTAAINLAVAGNCLAANTPVAANVRAIGTTRRQKSPQDCQLPQLRNLRAIYYAGSGATISYNVQDAQNMACELVIGNQRTVAKCDGDSHVLSAVAVDGFSPGSTTVSIFVNQAKLGTAKIEPSRIATNTSTVLTTPTITFTSNSATVSASISLDFSENMQPDYGTVGAYVPESSNWSTPRRFSVVFRSYTPGGIITFQKSAFLSVSGKRLGSDLLFTLPPSTTTTLTATSGRLPSSGITADQCYQIGSDTLVACSSAGALALNPQQDGHRAAINAMSYSDVPNSAGGNFPRTSCLKDNITGLIWEGKEASGQRAGSNKFTNYRVGYLGTQVQMDAPSNTYGYVNYVNSIALCSYNDWRLPTVDELQSIVDYSKPYPDAAINSLWFVNTGRAPFWSSSAYPFLKDLAWFVSIHGVVNNEQRDGTGSYATSSVRLVRGIN